MSRPLARPGFVLALFALSACSHAGPIGMPSGDPAYTIIPPKVTEDRTALIRQGDRLSIIVLGEPELTSDLYRVDPAGNLQVPLIGVVRAAGITLAELQSTIRRQLGEKYIRDPQVAISTVEREQAMFSVEGHVREPGVFEVGPSTTLLSALAQAKSPTRVARLDEIVVLREVGDQKMGARFDLTAIRNGAAPDPQILAGDTIVVGYSEVKGAWRDLLEAAPLFNLFYLLR